MAIIFGSRRRLVLPKFGMELPPSDSEATEPYQSSVYLYDFTSICWYELVLEMLPLISLLHLDCFNTIMGRLLWILSLGSLFFVRHITSWITYTQEQNYAFREKYRIVKNVWLTIFFALITLQIFNSAACDFLLMAVVAYGFYTVADFADVTGKFIVDKDPKREHRNIKYVVSEMFLRILSKLTILGGSAIAFFYIREAETALRVMFGSFLLSKLFLSGVFAISQKGCGMCKISQEGTGSDFLHDLQGPRQVIVASILTLDMISLGFLMLDPEALLIVSISFKGAATCFMVLFNFIHDYSFFFSEFKTNGGSITKILTSK
jgi:hypothetical protein